MSTMKITGTVVSIGNVQTFGSGFQKIEVAIDNSTNPKYPNPIPVEFTKEMIQQAQKLREGQQVTVEAYVNGRQWQPEGGPARYFLSLSAHRVDPYQEAAPEPRAKVEDYAELAAGDGDSDDLPF